jgi:Holliday junction resolvasome RuvABC endonuclease subunit
MAQPLSLVPTPTHAADALAVAFCQVTAPALLRLAQ